MAGTLMSFLWTAGWLTLILISCSGVAAVGLFHRTDSSRTGAKAPREKAPG